MNLDKGAEVDESEEEAMSPPRLKAMAVTHASYKTKSRRSR